MANSKDDAVIKRLIEQRDNAEESMSQAYLLVTGEPPEWSNHFGYKEALEEISDCVHRMKEAAKSASAVVK